MAPKELRKAKRIITFDYNSKFSPKNMGIGFKNEFHHTVYGIKVHKSCYDILYKTMVSGPGGAQIRQPLRTAIEDHREDLYNNHDSIENVIEKQINTAINQMHQCGQNYPGVNKHVSTWINKLKKTAILCDDRTSSEVGSLARAFPEHNALIFSPETFLKFMNKQSEIDYDDADGRDAFIHEMLHISHLDNNLVHIHNGNIPNVSVNCSTKDRLRDRVYFLHKLCSGTKMNASNTAVNPNQPDLPVDVLLAQKVKQCGMKTGCVDQFSLNEHRPADEKSAKKFCSNMVEMGKCKIELMKNMSSQIPANIGTIYNKLADKLINFVAQCNALFVHRSVRDVCPGAEQMRRHSRRLYKLVNDHHPNISKQRLINFLNDELNIKSFKSLSFTRNFLTEMEWAELISFQDQKSDKSLTKICAEKIKMRGIFDPNGGKLKGCKVK